MNPPLPVAAPRPPRRLEPVHWVGIRTLVARDLRRFLKDWLETIVAPVFATVMYLAVFAIALGPARATAEGEAVLHFVLPGLILMTVMTRASETTVFSLVFDKMEKIIWDVLSSPLQPSEMTAAYAATGMVTGLITGAPALAVGLLLFDLPVASPWLIGLFALLAALLLALVGIIAGLWAVKWDHVAAVFGFLLMPLTFLSGTFAPVDGLPGPLRLLAQAHPLFYLIDGFRAGFLGVSAVPPWISAAVSLAAIAVLWAVSDRLIRRGYNLKA